MAEQPVVNASPLILLVRGGWLDLLRLAGDEVLVPNRVAAEIQRRGPDDPTARALADTSWLVGVETPPIPAIIQAWDLGEGESRCWHGHMPIRVRERLSMICPLAAAPPLSVFRFVVRWDSF